jgi:RND family efflux transporter MFP subunit
MTRTNALFALSLLALAAPGYALDLAPVVSRPVSETVTLPGEFAPYLNVSLHAKVAGYVDRVLVDRGSEVKQGDLLAVLTAPEMAAQIAEADSKVEAAEAERLQAEAQLAAAQAAYDRMKKASETPGALAENELIQTEKQVDAAKALVSARQQATRAAQESVAALKDLQSYLQITAPFDGVVTDRLVHPGALVGPPTDPVLLVMQQVSRLRLVVAVPEEDTSGIAREARAEFTVPAWSDRTFSGTVARISHALDATTRTMPVELDVQNRDGALAPGMYPSVKWPVRRSRPGLFVPKTSVVTTTERTFVIRDRQGRAQWVDVRKGTAQSDLVEVFGELRAGDMIVRRATDEIREGALLARQ